MESTFVGTIPLRGDLRITVRRATSGEVHWRYEIRNTITYVALKSLVNLIAQPTSVTPADYSVTYLRLGTGTAAAVRGDINLAAPAPSAAAPLDLLLGNAQKFLTVSNPFEMKILTTLGASDLNGLNLTEAGLFIRGTITPTIPAPPTSPAISTYDGTHYPELFARQVHPAIPKSAAFVVDYDWRIAFTS
jgi:hypothetical protein